MNKKKHPVYSNTAPFTFTNYIWNIVVPYLRSDRKIAWMSFDLQEHETHDNVSLVMEHPLDLWAKKAVQSEMTSPIVTGQILIELSLHLSYWLPAPLTTWWWYPAAKRLSTMWTIRWTTLQCGICNKQCTVESEIACLQLSKPPPRQSSHKRCQLASWREPLKSVCFTNPNVCCIWTWLISLLLDPCFFSFGIHKSCHQNLYKL